MTLTATRTDYFKLHFIVLLWGFTAIGGKLISIPAVEMVFYRTLLAAMGMGAVILYNRGPFAVSTGDWLKLFFTGFIVGIHWLTFFRSGQVSNPSTSLVGFATCSLWAALFEPLANRKKIDVLEIGLGIGVVLGLALIFSFNFRYQTGLLLGIASGLTAALFAVINARLAVRVPAHTITFHEMIGAFVSVCLFLPFYQTHYTTDGQLRLMPVGTDWFYLAVLAWACSVYAYSVAINLTKKMSVFFIQLTLNLEPVYGILMAILVFGQQEIMGWNFYAGTLVILTAVAVYPMAKRRRAAYAKPYPE